MMVDFDEVLNDSEMGAETLQCVRITQTASPRGRAVNAEAAPVDFTGCVTEREGQILERLDAGSYVKGSILVTTAFPLRMAGPNVEADIVLRGGNRYNVNRIGEYLAHGFNWAVCNPDGIA